MILDSSAVVAILLREPGHEALVEKLGAATAPAIGAPTLLEATIVLVAKAGERMRPLLSLFVHEARIAVIPFGEEHQKVAAEAWLRYGKGRHRAALNFGDCMTYAIAGLAKQPVLCTGRDFGRTDALVA